MVATEAEVSRRIGGVLDPVERLSEILFGLIMALTFTGTIHAASDGHEEIRTVLIGAIGCNLAWGLVDAVMYVLTQFVTRGRALRALRALHALDTTEGQAATILADALPDEFTARMEPRDFENLHAWLKRVPAPPERVLTARALRGAVAVFLLVTISTFPVVVPFLFLKDAVTALRASHGTALAMLFLIGAAFGRQAGARPWRTGLAMLALGVVLAALAIALGG